VKAQGSLEAIRRLDGPSTDSLARMQNRLAGGAVQLERMRPPADLRSAHELIVSAWRFAEQALQVRRSAVATADLSRAWEASAAAAASLMMLADAQRALHAFTEPPRFR
jgi:hypothetical protein